MTLPRVAERQKHRGNTPSNNANEYWRRTIIIPCLDSLISSLKIRFSTEYRPPFELSFIHPACMMDKEKTEFLTITHNMKGEAELACDVAEEKIIKGRSKRD